jgi:Flp pilus assembly pilin Flp
MARFALFVRSVVRGEEGQDLVEYALLVALISLGAVTAVGLAGGQINNVFNAIVSAIPVPPAA